MPERKMNFIELAHYHLTNRGLQKRKIFLYNEDYDQFLKIIEKYKQIYSVEIVFYCLMPNHFHLIIRQNKSEGAFKFISIIQLVYAKYSNKKYGRKGQLYDGRYRCKEIKTMEYMLYLVKYLSNNPVKAGLVKKSEDWKYLSFNKSINQGWNSE